MRSTRLGVEAERAHGWAPVALVRSAPPLGESVARRSTWKDHTDTPTATHDDRILDHRATELVSTVMDTPVGPITIVASDAWRAGDPVARRYDGRVPISAAAPDPDHPVIAATVAQLDEYFAGEREEFDLPLDPVGTDFQQSAWMALRTIPYGTTVSYGEQAARMGDRRKARAVGARTVGTRSRSWCRAIGWSARTERSPDSPAASTPRPGCSTTSSVAGVTGV